MHTRRHSRYFSHLATIDTSYFLEVSWMNTFLCKTCLKTGNRSQRHHWDIGQKVKSRLKGSSSCRSIQYILQMVRGVARLSTSCDQERNISSHFPHSHIYSFIFPQFYLIFFLNLIIVHPATPLHCKWQIYDRKSIVIVQMPISVLNYVENLTTSFSKQTILVCSMWCADSAHHIHNFCLCQK